MPLPLTSVLRRSCRFGRACVLPSPFPRAGFALVPRDASKAYDALEHAPSAGKGRLKTPPLYAPLWVGVGC